MATRVYEFASDTGLANFKMDLDDLGIFWEQSGMQVTVDDSDDITDDLAADSGGGFLP